MGIFEKKLCDLSVMEIIEYNYAASVMSKPTMTAQEFCKCSNMPRGKLTSLLRNKLLPDELLVGGYEGRSQRKPLLFITSNVIEWLKLRMVVRHDTAETFYRENFKSIK